MDKKELKNKLFLYGFKNHPRDEHATWQAKYTYGEILINWYSNKVYLHYPIKGNIARTVLAYKTRKHGYKKLWDKILEILNETNT